MTKSNRFNWTAFRMDLESIVERDVTLEEAKMVRRWLNGHNTIQEQFCSEDMSGERRARVEAREKGIETRLAAFFGPRLREFTGDPRGATTKLTVPAATGYMASRMGRMLTYFGRDMGGDLIFLGN